MNHLQRRKFSRDQVMMTLCAIAYTPFESITALQDNLDGAEALGQDHTVIWWGKNDTAAVYATKNRSTGDYTISFRGRVFRFGLSLLLDLYEDLDVANQVSLPHSRLGNAKIAAGILQTLQGIYDLTYTGRTLHQLLNNLPAGTRVHISGHSVGGALAAAFAAKTACSNSVNLDIVLRTFGAPAVGNNAYADLFNSEKVNCLFRQPSRCDNSRDIIPYTWNDLGSIPTIDYGPLNCPVEFSLCVDGVERLLILSRVFYVQPPLQLELKGNYEPCDTFFHEAMYQHQHNTYLSLLGLAPITGTEFTYKLRKEVKLANSL